MRFRVKADGHDRQAYTCFMLIVDCASDRLAGCSAGDLGAPPGTRWTPHGMSQDNSPFASRSCTVANMMLEWLFAAMVVLYGGFVTLLCVAQRRLQYFPERQRTAPRVAGLPEAEETVLDTADGERVIVWHVPPRQERPVFLYFHGNGRLERTADREGPRRRCCGSLRIRYRALSCRSYRPVGELLGSALAVAVAAEKPVGQVVLEAPFTSAVDVGAQHYWFVPVRLFMKDQFRSDLRVRAVTAPVLVVHGENDAIVPVVLGERLYGLIRAPKQFVRVAGAGHSDLGDQAVAAAKRFIARHAEDAVSESRLLTNDGRFCVDRLF